MFLKRFKITRWELQEGFIWFDFNQGCCGCKFLTILNVLFIVLDKECFIDSQLFSGDVDTSGDTDEENS